MSKRTTSKLFLAASLFIGLNAFVACGGGPKAEVEPTSVAEEVAQPGQMEAAKTEAMGQKKPTTSFAKIFEAKVKLGIPTGEEAKEEAAPAADAQAK